MVWKSVKKYCATHKIAQTFNVIQLENWDVDDVEWIYILLTGIKYKISIIIQFMINIILVISFSIYYNELTVKVEISVKDQILRAYKQPR